MSISNVGRGTDSPPAHMSKKSVLMTSPVLPVEGYNEVHNLIIDPDHNKINNYTQAFVSEENRLNRKRYKKMNLTKGNNMFCWGKAHKLFFLFEQFNVFEDWAGTWHDCPQRSHLQLFDFKGVCVCVCGADNVTVDEGDVDSSPHVVFHAAHYSTTSVIRASGAEYTGNICISQETTLPGNTVRPWGPKLYCKFLHTVKRTVVKLSSGALYALSV